MADIDNTKIQQEEEAPIGVKTITEYVQPVAPDGSAYRAMYHNVDTSEESVAKAPSIMELTNLGKQATDRYREQQQKYSRAGKFAAWNQFANALAAFAGGWAGGGAPTPIQQNTNIPLSALQKADAYRDAMTQVEQQYGNAIINARQNERNRRLQQANSFLELAQKQDELSRKYGIKTRQEYNPLQSAKDEADIALKLARAEWLKKGGSRAGKSDFTNYYYDVKFIVPSTGGKFAGMGITGPMITPLLSAINAEADKARVLKAKGLETNEYQEQLIKDSDALNKLMIMDETELITTNGDRKIYETILKYLMNSNMGPALAQIVNDKRYQYQIRRKSATPDNSVGTTFTAEDIAGFLE